MKAIIFSCLFVSTAAHAQWEFSVASGIGYYQMDDVRRLQTLTQDQLPVRAQLTSDFPPFPHYELGGRFIVPNTKLLLGGNLSLLSTGSRLSYADYSGNLTSDQKLVGLGMVATFGTFCPIRNSKFGIAADLKPGVIGTRFLWSTKESIGTYSSREQTLFYSLNFSLQPTVTISYDFGIWKLFIFGGYHATIWGGRLLVKGGEGAHIGSTRQGDKYSNADWSGARFGIGAAVPYSRQTHRRRR